MNIMLVGADKKLLNQIEHRISDQFFPTQVSQCVAINKAIEEAGTTPFDIIVNALPVSVDDGVNLSKAFRTTSSNCFTPVILFSNDTEFKGSLNLLSFVSYQPIHLARNLEELLYLVESVAKFPAELADAA